MPKLVFTQPEFAGQSCGLRDGIITIGRSRRNEIIIEENSVSSDHGDLLVHNQEVIVRERGSRNGIFVNGVRIQAQSGVTHGQTIRFGRVEVRLDLEPVPDENATDITAMHASRRLRGKGAAPAPAMPGFPARFLPQRPASADHAMSSLPLRPNDSSSPTTPPSTDHTANRKLPVVTATADACSWIV